MRTILQDRAELDAILELAATFVRSEFGRAKLEHRERASWEECLKEAIRSRHSGLTPSQLEHWVAECKARLNEHKRPIREAARQRKEHAKRVRAHDRRQRTFKFS